jgi:hypothetical protein
MKLYGAPVQIEIPNNQNPHGLQEGWTVLLNKEMNLQKI